MTERLTLLFSFFLTEISPPEAPHLADCATPGAAS
ncbi:hypothetical protein OCH239_07875 [Roseivivax halodurans JCM 10272]|uniref:Uncharacterized protein n=1 Tax=Roseivivax halodurans JCM 10272 TaxID=1449350 RepID=X7EK03_9RHOB|nr:hypothetical protein OCH239_07875 [Roseivivax halodurans JCM 10272]